MSYVIAAHSAKLRRSSDAVTLGALLLLAAWNALNNARPHQPTRFVPAPQVASIRADVPYPAAVPIAALPRTLPAVAGYTFAPASVPGRVFVRSDARALISTRTEPGKVGESVRKTHGAKAAAALLDAYQKNPEALRRADGYEMAFAPGSAVPFYVSLHKNTTQGTRYRVGGRWYDAQGRRSVEVPLRMPLDGGRVSSSFGYRMHPIYGEAKMHTGVDLSAPMGRKIYAAAAGTVAFAGHETGYGNYVVIRHNGTYETAYAHLRNMAPGIRVGQSVRRGDVIGAVGMTGDATGPHLHFEVIENGEFVNPMKVKSVGVVEEVADRAQLQKIVTAVRTLKQNGGAQ